MFLRQCLLWLGHFRLGLLALALSGAAQAEPATPASSPPAANPPAAAPAPTVMSESKFLGLLYSEIAKHTPEKSPAGAGEVTASFHINAAGKVDKVTIDKTTSSALADAVKKILASVSTPSPPGGGMDVGQTFRFNKSEEEK